MRVRLRHVSPNKLDLSASYELPFGAGKRYLTDGVAAAILGGWQLNAYFTAFSGSTMTMTANGASLNAPGSPQRADEVTAVRGVGRSRTEQPLVRYDVVCSGDAGAVRNIQGEWLSWARICQPRCQSVPDVPLLAVGHGPGPPRGAQCDEHATLGQSRHERQRHRFRPDYLYRESWPRIRRTKHSTRGSTDVLRSA